MDALWLNLRSDLAYRVFTLVNGYPSGMREQKPLAFLQAVIDDSGSDRGDKRLFMAGFISTAENWALFSDAWAHELNSGRSIRYLKMSEAAARTGEFSGWSKPEVSEKLARLKRVIDHFQPLSFHNSLGRGPEWEPFKAVAPRGLRNAHFSCTFGIVSSVSRFVASQGLQNKIEFIFDRQADIEDEIDLFFDYMAKNLPEDAQALIASKPRHEDDKAFAPLQAADMLAWHLRRRHEDLGGWDKEAEDLTPINTSSHLDCGDLDALLPSSHAKISELMEGVSGLASKGEWQRLKKEARRLKAAGYVPPNSSSRDVQSRALKKWQRVTAFKEWLRKLFNR